jgi:hypothetical protein
MNAHSPLISEFATPEEAAAYEEWLNAKVVKSLAGDRSPVAHDEAMARARAIIEARRDKAC